MRKNKNKMSRELEEIYSTTRNYPKYAKIGDIFMIDDEPYILAVTEFAGAKLIGIVCANRYYEGVFDEFDRRVRFDDIRNKLDKSACDWKYFGQCEIKIMR